MGRVDATRTPLGGDRSPLLFGGSPAAPEGLCSDRLSLAACLDALAGEIRRAPTLSNAEPRLRPLALRLPVCNPAAFEIRLGSDGGQVDLAIRLPREPFSLGAVGNGLPEWQRIARLSELPLDRGSSVRAVDLEFDLPADGPAVPLPRIFLELEGNPDLTCLGRLAAEAAGSRVLEPVLRRCCAALPAGGRILHMGFGLRQAQAGLRAVVSGVPREDCAAFLARLGWPADAPAGFDVVDGLAGARVDLALDLVEAGVRRVGFELFRESFAPAGSWRPILERLEQAGLCLRERADEFTGWSGFSTHPAAGLEITRFPSHVKIACEAGGTPEAKAYLGLGLRRLGGSRPAGAPGALAGGDAPR